jgi:uncharacterized membrane protein
MSDAASSPLRRVWRHLRTRMFEGLLLVLPVLITLWVVYWLYATLKRLVIDPLTHLVLWKSQGARPDQELSFVFENYLAPVMAMIVALALLYGLGWVVHSRLRHAIDWTMLRVPVISTVYNNVRQVFHTLEKQASRQGLQRVVLVAFPHPGMRVPAFVTATCRDSVTQKTLLCVYVPTTPVPTSGYFLLVPEDEVTEPDWTVEQALQTIISGGLTVPDEVRYYRIGSGASNREGEQR